jgi:gliding motility-associated-like protein
MKLRLLSLLVVICINLPAQVNLNNGLVAFYPFNGNALDEALNGIDGIVNGATLTTDRNNLLSKAFYFDGVDDFIQLPYSNLYNFPINGAFTISVWIQPTQNNNWPAQALVVKSPPNSNYLASMWNYGTYMFNYKAMGGFANNNVLNGTTLFTLNQCWYNIIQTYDNGKWQMYVNGILESSDLSQTRFILQDGPGSKIALGRKGESSGDYYKGKMDDIRIYNRVINADEVAALSSGATSCAQLNCNNWLNTPSQGSIVNVGNLTVTGNKITVEGTFNCTAYSSPNFGGNLIAKHTNQINVSYALSPHGAEISTSNNGYVYTLQNCNFELNKTYHVAMVYDGATLKFYRNGFLLSQVPCSGNISTNSLSAIIGNGPALPTANQFFGNINELRIWNVARTQNEIRNYMNTSLPTPNTQIGLVAYYTFDNLLNKQGNAAFNGTLNGGATINATNPNCTYVADSCNVVTSNPCTNWLKLSSVPSSVKVGDLDISGNKITVEANFNRDAFFTPAGFSSLDIVSKHNDPSDVNYLLRPNSAEVTTTNGFYQTPPVCETELNKTYHVAMVYDGATLKFYRNGFLMKQIAATGNLVLNNWQTCIGLYDPQITNTNFLGYINEVRIWNIARTQTELRAYMNASLPNPITQAGLKGYYVFDNLLNKQGNAAFNGTLNGGATINATNPNCTFVADSCNIVTPQETIINDYTPILALDQCKNTLTVGNAAAYNVGDTVLMIQMKGAIIDSTNTAAFGNVTDYKSAGNYEYNYVKSKIGNQIELKNKILRTYEIPNAKIQLIRVPYYQNYTTTSTLTCLPWDGTIGGVLVFNVANTLTLNNNIDVSNKGFRGGLYEQQISSCGENGFFHSQTSASGAYKGEGIAVLSSNLVKGKGKSANGGGGGNDHNSGGAGGSNFGQGGNGGKEFALGGTCVQQNNGGIGGASLLYNNASNKIYLGGGGGAGDINGTLGGFKGGNGGGIVIVSANNLVVSNNNSILTKGEKAQDCLTNDCWESGSGGGSGGTVLLDVNNIAGSLAINSSGGNGGNLSNSNPGGYSAPGGGGGGGLLWLKSSTLNTNHTTVGGQKGVFVALNESGGATDGAAGGALINLVLPITTIPFKPNIDSVKINALNTSCFSYNFSGLGYTNTNAIATWQWSFGDNTTATGQNVSHTYTTANTFTVKLVVTDINGCKDSVTRNVTTNTLSVDAGNNQTFCGSQIGFQLNGTAAATGTLTYGWTSVPTTTISNTGIINPTANINATTTFYFTVTTTQGCTGIDSVKVTINPIPVVQTINDIAICKGTTLQLTATPGLASYQWTNGIYVSDSTIANPIFTDTIPRTLIVTGSNELCSAKDTINISIKPLPVVRTIKDTTICSTQNISLTTTGASTYSWTPSIFLSSTTATNPTYIGTGTTSTTTTYYVTGTAANGCSAKDTLVVKMNVPNTFIDPPNKSFCKNESVELNGNNGNDVTYNWQPPTDISNPNIINPVVNPASTTPYTVNITDPVCNFSKTFTVLVTVNPLPNITITKSNDVTCNKASTTLNANGASNYTWSNSPTLSNTGIANPIANPTTNTTYTVTGTDINGCKNNNKITVLVNLSKNILDLPNTFTPNADGKNDCFGALNWGNATEVFFIIYNRWGEKVFETTNINNCWNGEFKGQQAIQGNYVYFIRAKTACGDVVKKGNVLLMR